MGRTRDRGEYGQRAAFRRILVLRTLGILKGKEERAGFPKKKAIREKPMNKEGGNFDRECCILEICNPHPAKEGG
jgi:hypothetical protein